MWKARQAWAAREAINDLYRNELRLFQNLLNPLQRVHVRKVMESIRQSLV
jgi:hypothetical protein